MAEKQERKQGILPKTRSGSARLDLEDSRAAIGRTAKKKQPVR